MKPTGSPLAAGASGHTCEISNEASFGEPVQWFAERDGMGDWDIIRSELHAAEREQRTISDLAARVIATQFHGGQASALYALSSTGTITNGWDSEIRTATTHSDGDQERRALEALAAYCQRRRDKGRQPNWSALRW